MLSTKRQGPVSPPQLAAGPPLLAARCAGLLGFWLCIAAAAAPLRAETYQVGPEGDWFALLSAGDLQPGDQVVLRGGTYSDQRRLVIGHRGSAERPIVIRAADGERVVFRRPNATQNTLNLEGAQHLHLRSFEITGGAAGIRIHPGGDQPVRGIVLEDLHLHHLGGVAVTCNHPGGVYERMVFRLNHIHHTSGHGEAFYLGGNEASATFRDSVVELNYIHHLQGPEVSQGDGVELKHGSYGNRVFGNMIHDTQYPGIIVYGTVGMPGNVIEENLIWNSGDHGIQAAADAIIRRNWIARAGGAGIYCRNHQQAIAGNLDIRENVILDSRAEAIRIERPSGPSGNGEYSGPVRIVGNLLMAPAERLAVRVGSSSLLTFADTSGRGRVEGIRPAEKDWKRASQAEFELPELKENPAWRHLSRDAVRAIFSDSRFEGSTP